MNIHLEEWKDSNKK